MGFFDVFDSGSGVHVSHHTGDEGVDHFFGGVFHGFVNLAKIALPAALVVYSAKTISDALSGKKKHR